MIIRLLKSRDTKTLEEYLDPYKAECMFICSNLNAAGIEYQGLAFEGEYFGCFDKQDINQEYLLGVIVHYWNGNVMMHALNHDVLEKLIFHLKKNVNRFIAGILGPNIQVEYVIKKLGLLKHSFRINRNEGLYEINFEDLNDFSMPISINVVSAQDVSKTILIKWIKSYYSESLGALNDDNLEKQAQEHWNLRLKKNDSYVLLLDGVPVALSTFNARLVDMVQVGPVWTPPEYRNKGFARLLLSYILHQEKLKGTKKAILFTDNPAAIRAYIAIGFDRIGNYRVALLEKPIRLQEIEFTTSTIAADIDFLTHKINQETPEFGEANPFAFFIRDEHNQIIAGCNGSVIFGSIYTDQLWVHPAHRNNGLGKKLMEAVHDYGRKSGCLIATISTMSFQGALVFYEKLGYVIDFERRGYKKNSTCLFMRKEL
jgi:GNAT superfamily N-acetyltransferase